MTTVPVRALTITLAGGSAAVTSRFSMPAIIAARACTPGVARTDTETASTACAVPRP